MATRRDPRAKRTAASSEYVTLFRVPGERCIPANTVFIVAAIVFLCVAFITRVMLEVNAGLYMAPAVAFWVWRFGMGRSEKIFFFVQKNGKNEISFGYMDSEKRRQGDFPVDEYTHWYTEGMPAIGKQKNFTLYVLIRNPWQEIYLKEEIRSEEPPAGWTLSEENVENKKDVFLLTGLKMLITELDKNTGSNQ